MWIKKREDNSFEEYSGALFGIVGNKERGIFKYDNVDVRRLSWVVDENGNGSIFCGDPIPVEKAIRVFSKLKIKRELEKINVRDSGNAWEDLKNILQSTSGAWDDFSQALELREDDPSFVALSQEIMPMLLPEGSQIDVDEFLNRCILT